jgi:hypothetical protein
LRAAESIEVRFKTQQARKSVAHLILRQVLARRMRIEPLLLWSLNAILPDGGIGVDRPDQVSCGLMMDTGSNNPCLPEGYVVWLGRYVIPQENESLAALCSRYKCTAGVKHEFFFTSSKHS